jgi:hypothetical protein
MIANPQEEIVQTLLGNEVNAFNKAAKAAMTEISFIQNKLRQIPR